MYILERPMTARAYGWLAAAIGFLLTFVILAALVRWHYVDGADHLARSIVVQPGPSLLRSSMQVASFWGGQAGQIGVIAVACAVFWPRRRRWAFSLPLIMAGTGLLQLVAKWGMNRARPNLDPWGFPSAHVLSLVVLFGCIAYVVGTSRLHRRCRWLAVGGCALIVCTVAYSRMYLDAHWLSDVLGGFSIGLAYLLAVIWVQSAVGRPGQGPPATEQAVPTLLPRLGTELMQPR